MAEQEAHDFVRSSGSGWFGDHDDAHRFGAVDPVQIWQTTFDRVREAARGAGEQPDYDFAGRTARMAFELAKSDAEGPKGVHNYIDQAMAQVEIEPSHAQQCAARAITKRIIDISTDLL